MALETKIVLLTHGGWGTHLVESLGMVLGPITCTYEIPLTPSLTLSEYMGQVDAYLDTVAEDSLIITDIFGGTTSNVAAKLGNERGVRVLSGLSAPLLLEACSQLQFNGALDVDRLLEVGEGACKDVVATIRARAKRDS